MVQFLQCRSEFPAEADIYFSSTFLGSHVMSVDGPRIQDSR
jgi:hypothetical protein